MIVRFVRLLHSFVRSLLLTIILSFAAPMFLIGGALASVSLIVHIPGLQGIGQLITKQILQFLATFGSGNSLQGLIVISLTCSLVGALFDTYAFYRSQILRDL